MFLFPYSRWVGGIFYEHGHRLLAATVGSLTLGLACWLALREERAWVRGLGYTAVGLVMLQGGLGGLTVLLGLSIIVSSLHAVIAQTFFLLLLTIAYSLSVEYRQSNAPAHRWTRAAALLAMAVLYLQLAVGAVMRHSGAGMAIPDLPTAGGAWIPQFDEAMIANVNLLRDGLGLRHVGLYEIALHFAHRVGALLVVASQGFLVVTALRAGGVLKRSAWLNLNLLILQFSLGLFTVLSAKEPFVTSLHVLGGALLLGATWLLVLRSSARTAPGVDAGTG
jgi:cytochrome c oxidase assembly protein subunit 15